MKEVFIIVNGKSEHSLKGYVDIWESSNNLIGYYESKDNAESILANLGYERDSDDVYFLLDAEEDNQKIAKIISLVKLI